MPSRGEEITTTATTTTTTKSNLVKQTKWYFEKDGGRWRCHTIRKRWWSM